MPTTSIRASTRTRGRLDVVVEAHHVLAVEAPAKAQRHAGDVGRLAGGVLGQVAFGLAGFGDVEAELARLLAQLRQLVLTGRGVEEVGAATPVSMSRPVASMPSGRSARMASLTS